MGEDDKKMNVYQEIGIPPEDCKIAEIGFRMDKGIAEIKDQIEDYRKKIETEVDFDSKNHLYYCKKNGIFLTGVTTILNVRRKDFLQWWTVKECAKYLGWFDKKEKDETLLNNLIKRHSEIISMDVDSYWRELDRAKKAHTVKSDKGKEKGSVVHEWIKNYIRGVQQPTPSDEEVLSCVQAFLNWESQHKIEWLVSEMIVWSPIHLFAGTLDFLCILDGRFTLGDIKTSNMISEEYFLQTGAYDLCLEEADIIPEQRLIVRISKDGSGFEAMIVPTSLDFDCKTFLHLREAYRWNLYVQNFKDDKGKIILG